MSISSAIEIDLFGQANLEWLGNRMISGVGGAPDFVHGAALARDGVSVLASQSTAARGSVSSIVPKLLSPTVSIPRNSMDTDVTEYGVARLRYLHLEQRAQALIALAAPEFRDGLQAAWAEMYSII